jgi:hypothetical protein
MGIEAADDDPGHFYVAEARRILGVEGLTHAQMQEIYVLVREQAGMSVPPGKWCPFTYADLACAVQVIRLCVDLDELREKGRTRLRLHHVRQACAGLRRQGLTNPLLEADLYWSGRRVVADLGQMLIEARSGQLLDDRIVERLEPLAGTVGADPALVRRVLQARSRARGASDGSSPAHS